MTGLRSDCGDDFEKSSENVWNILIDKAETEAYDKIKMVLEGERFRSQRQSSERECRPRQRCQRGRTSSVSDGEKSAVRDSFGEW